MVLFRAFDLLDVYGPLEVLQSTSSYHKIDVALISETMDTVVTQPLMATMNPMNSSVYPTLAPTHTFETAPELDVLIIAGGAGMRSPFINSTLEYIAKTAPKVKHIITICSGSGLAARAGIMNGRKVNNSAHIVVSLCMLTEYTRRPQTKLPGQALLPSDRTPPGSRTPVGLRMNRVRRQSGARRV